MVRVLRFRYFLALDHWNEITTTFADFLMQQMPGSNERLKPAPKDHC